MSFEIEHDKWMKRHLSRRQGERKDALKRGHGYGNRLFVEKIWWPLVGQFHNLHPEYEVLDWRGRSYFVDLMWVCGSVRFAFEIMDYGSHGKDRTKYRMDMNRALFLQSLQCYVIEISLDEMQENPSFILVAIKNILGPYLDASMQQTGGGEPHQFEKSEQQLIRYAARRNRIIRPAEAAHALDLHKQTVIKYCVSLVHKGRLRPIRTGALGKIFRYEYIGTLQNLFGI